MERTDTSQLTTDAPQASTVTALPPRPPFPAPPTRATPLGHDFVFNRGAYDEAYDRFRHHADRAFGDGAA